jgi:hypothetical protein
MQNIQHSFSALSPMSFLTTGKSYFIDEHCLVEFKMIMILIRSLKAHLIIPRSLSGKENPWNPSVPSETLTKGL